MTLRKTAGSCFIWGVFAAFLAALVAMFWFFSGILPDEQRLLLSVVLTLLTIFAVCLIAFAVGRLVDFLQARVHPDAQAAGIIGDVSAGVLLLAVFLARILYLSKHVSDIADPEGLFTASMIGADGAEIPKGMLSSVTVGLLRPFLKLAGNRIIVAAVVMAVLQTVMIICFYFSVRLLTGRMAAFIAAGITGFLPVPYASLLAVSSQTVMLCVFALTFLLIALYLHFDASGTGGRPFLIVCSVIVGAMLGFTLYLDPAALILWIPLLFAFAIPDADRGAEAVRIAIILSLSVAVAVILLACEDTSMADALSAYTGTFFGQTDTIRIFHLPLDAYPVYLVTATAMAVVLVTFWREHFSDRLSFWLLFCLGILLLLPLFGATRLNAQELICFGYAAVTGAGITCFVTVHDSQILPVATVLQTADDGSAAGAVPEGMVLPVGDGSDDGESRMRMPEIGEIQTPIGLDRGQEGGDTMGATMDETPQTEAGPVLTKEAQKALARAQKAKAKADAKAMKAEAKAAKKAEKERLRMLADAEEEAEELAARGLAPVQPAQVTAPVSAAQSDDKPAEQAPAAQAQAAAAVQAATAAQTAAEKAKKETKAAESSRPPKAISLSAISPFAGRAPQTSQPNLVRNTAFNPDGSDDFDYDINGEDDFDV
ncbi:MAG: glycosyltransferase family 39 protein [Lachnospiraceae bacterium]|nr:glycosyltransferase family 39 protein [Lachnospiraceae bacterium]